MYYTYILESEINGQLYIGQTQNLGSRLERHNKGMVKSTKGKRPWNLLFSLEFDTHSEAVRLETRLKSFKNLPTRLLDNINRKD